jgi:glycine C-acetyltransferase
MPLVVGALKRLELLRTKPELRENLWNIVRALQNGLRERGFNIGITSSPVTPVVLTGDDTHAAALVSDLRENFNIFCSMVIYPVIPRGLIILRLIPTAVHTLDDVQETITAFEAILHKLNSGYYANIEYTALKPESV